MLFNTHVSEKDRFNYCDLINIGGLNFRILTSINYNSKNLKKSDKSRLEQAKVALKKLYGRDAL